MKLTNVDAFTLEKLASTQDFFLDVSWLLEQSTLDYLLSNWGAFLSSCIYKMAQ